MYLGWLSSNMQDIVLEIISNLSEWPWRKWQNGFERHRSQCLNEIVGLMTNEVAYCQKHMPRYQKHTKSKYPEAQ